MNLENGTYSSIGFTVGVRDELLTKNTAASLSFDIEQVRR
jgi:hypothetical protein